MKEYIREADISVNIITAWKTSSNAVINKSKQFKRCDTLMKSTTQQNQQAVLPSQNHNHNLLNPKYISPTT